nr:uncharacterized protein LOC128690117 [Cherax quadricarinatus]
MFVRQEVQDTQRMLEVCGCQHGAAALMGVMVGVLVGVCVAEGGGQAYVLGEAGTRGQSVITTIPTSSLTLCAAACLTESICLGMNWLGTSCETLSSLRTVVADPTSSIYVPDIQRTSVVLQYSCPSCYGSQPLGISNWTLECPHSNGVVVGVAAAASDFSRFGWLLCAQPAGLVLNYSIACVHQTGSCNNRNLQWVSRNQNITLQVGTNT